MQDTHSPPSAIHFVLVPVHEAALRDFQASNDTGDLVIDRQLFRRFDEINDLRFAGCLIARRTMELVQTIKFALDGNSYTWEFDQRKQCGWRTMGIEPLLEIENEVTEEKWWYVYHFHDSGSWMWCQLVPHRGESWGYSLPVQSARVFYLLTALVYAAVIYGIASLGVVMLIVALLAE
jgi:hypothetical protein